MNETAEQNESPDAADSSSSSNFLDKAKNFITLGGDKKKWTRVLIISAIVIAIMGIASLMIWGIALWALARATASGLDGADARDDGGSGAATARRGLTAAAEYWLSRSNARSWIPMRSRCCKTWSRRPSTKHWARPGRWPPRPLDRLRAGSQYQDWTPCFPDSAR